MFELLKMAHLITIAMASGLMLAHYITLRSSVGRENEPGLALARRAIAEITSFSVLFAWVSGLTLLWSRAGEGEGPLSAWFYAKIALVVTFTLAHGMQRVSAVRLRRAGDMVVARRVVERWVSVAWLTALFAVCFAVISFR